MSEPTPPGIDAYVGLGSNLDDPVAHVRDAVTALTRLKRVRVSACSSLYRTAPVGLQSQPDFVNAVCRLRTALPAETLMRALLDIERAHGRVRTGDAGGPRTLDLDLLLYADRTLRTPALTLPHPRLHERAFVLYPLHEIAPDLVVPGRGPVRDLLASCAGQRIEKLND